MKLGNRSRHMQILLMLALLIIPVISGQDAYSQDSTPFGDATGKNTACLNCHGDQKSVSARSYINPLRFGHTTHAAFGCVTCHDTITPAHPDGKAVARTTSCRDCHQDIIAEYSTCSHAAKASCSGCHNPHQVSRPDEISADDLNRMCSNCHRKHAITASHSKWLPQAELHLSAITCTTCHSKAESYVINIYISRQKAGKSDDKLEPASHAELQRLAGNRTVHSLIDRNSDNLISLEELRLFNKSQVYADYSLKSMLVPVKPTHAFQTFDNRWDCTSCHASGTGTMQTSFVSFPELDGTFRQVPVEKGAVLDALHAIPNFYLMGSTRNSTLNKIGLLIIAGGMVMPVGHGFLRFLTRKNRK